MRRLRHDLNHLVSAALLVAAVATILTGIVADLWDLNDSAGIPTPGTG